MRKDILALAIVKKGGGGGQLDDGLYNVENGNAENLKTKVCASDSSGEMIAQGRYADDDPGAETGSIFYYKDGANMNNIYLEGIIGNEAHYVWGNKTIGLIQDSLTTGAYYQAEFVTEGNNQHILKRVAAPYPEPTGTYIIEEVGTYDVKDKAIARLSANRSFYTRTQNYPNHIYGTGVRAYNLKRPYMNLEIDIAGGSFDLTLNSSYDVVEQEGNIDINYVNALKNLVDNFLSAHTFSGYDGLLYYSVITAENASGGSETTVYHEDFRYYLGLEENNDRHFTPRQVPFVFSCDSGTGEIVDLNTGWSYYSYEDNGDTVSGEYFVPMYFDSESGYYILFAYGYFNKKSDYNQYNRGIRLEFLANSVGFLGLDSIRDMESAVSQWAEDNNVQGFKIYFLNGYCHTVSIEQFIESVYWEYECVYFGLDSGGSGSGGGSGGGSGSGY